MSKQYGWQLDQPIRLHAFIHLTSWQFERQCTGRHSTSIIGLSASAARKLRKSRFYGSTIKSVHHSRESMRIAIEARPVLFSAFCSTTGLVQSTEAQRQRVVSSYIWPLSTPLAVAASHRRLCIHLGHPHPPYAGARFSMPSKVSTAIALVLARPGAGPTTVCILSNHCAGATPAGAAPGGYLLTWSLARHPGPVA